MKKKKKENQKNKSKGASFFLLLLKEPPLFAFFLSSTLFCVRNCKCSTVGIDLSVFGCLLLHFRERKRGKRGFLLQRNERRKGMRQTYAVPPPPSRTPDPAAGDAASDDGTDRLRTYQVWKGSNVSLYSPWGLLIVELNLGTYSIVSFTISFSQFCGLKWVG